MEVVSSDGQNLIDPNLLAMDAPAAVVGGVYDRQIRQSTTRMLRGPKRGPVPSNGLGEVELFHVAEGKSIGWRTPQMPDGAKVTSALLPRANAERGRAAMSSLAQRSMNGSV